MVKKNPSQPDISSPIDFRIMQDARKWEKTAMDRPFRMDFFDAFATELGKINQSPLRVLELGSGPGFLAAHLLDKLPGLQLTLLDFSPAMHELARNRIGNTARVKYIEKSFKDPDWQKGLGNFDAVITNQAVHELRHKQYATDLHSQVKTLLTDNGIYLMCDHYYGEGAMVNDQLYMSLEEHQASLISAGYQPTEIMTKGGRVLYSAQDVIK